MLREDPRWDLSRVESCVSLVVPTRHEAGNVGPLTERVSLALKDGYFDWELIFVDDSDDETVLEIIDLAGGELPVRLVHRSRSARIGGLAGAVVAGFEHARGDVLVVLDADLQHPPEAISTLVGLLHEGVCDLAVASRYVAGGEEAGLSGPLRRLVSQTAPLLTRILFPRIRSVRDPLSGFFACRRHVVEGCRLSPVGFKILLEILVRGQWQSIREVPYVFSVRREGRSKAGWSEGLRFGRHLLRLRVIGLR